MFSPALASQNGILQSLCLALQEVAGLGGVESWSQGLFGRDVTLSASVGCVKAGSPFCGERFNMETFSGDEGTNAKLYV